MDIRISEIAERVTGWYKEGYAYPYKLDFFVTNRCNLKCRFCQFPLLEQKNYKNELSKDMLFSLINEASKLDVKIIGILGGEPFLRKDVILPLMSLIKNKGIDGSLVTNGTLLSTKQIKEIIKIKWDLIRFSLDSSSEKLHDFLRGGKSFNKVILNIKTFQKFKKELSKTIPAIEINTVICRKNIKDIPEIIKLASKLEINNILFLPMIEFIDNIEYLKIRDKDITLLLQQIKKAKKIAEKYNIITNLDTIEHDSLFTKANHMEKIILSTDKEREKDFIPCYLPWYGLNISTEGIVTPCAAASGNPELYCGNVHESNLETIWKNKAFVRLRKRMIRRKLPEVCSKCCVPLLDENKQIRGLLAK